MTVGESLTFALWFVGLPIAISSFDDFICDLIYWGLTFRRWRRMGRRWRPLTLADLHSRPEQAIALLVPAWREAGVIGRMLAHTVASIDYAHYRVFVGCYPNDPETIAEIDSLAAGDGRIVRVLCPRPGPTSKADCLNAVWRAVTAWERVHGAEHAIIAIHDAEDVIDPLSLKLFNYVIPRKDMAQLPVAALERDWRNPTGAHYMDEFAEQHGRELVTREFLARQVPSAGVGFALSRRAILALAQNGAPFDTASLTEDYDLALRLNALGMSEIFVRFLGPRGLVATREYFPGRFAAAVRQKTRWTIGIVFQAWAAHGWPREGRMIHALWRDRKAVLAIPLGMMAMVLAVIMGSLALTVPMQLPVIATGSPLAVLLMLNAAFFVDRAVHRIYFVQRLYGWPAALGSAPRLLWATVINFAAVSRAAFLWMRHLRSGRPIGWDKTAHDFPDFPVTPPERRRFGEIALTRGWLRADQIAAALADQETQPLRLGEILRRRGWLNQEQVRMILRDQAA